MSARIAIAKPNPQSAIRNPQFPVFFFWGLLVVSVLGLFVLPWPIATKLHGVVHGLCAQRASHSVALGGTNLPFDARMAGIYGGEIGRAHV